MRPGAVAVTGASGLIGRRLCVRFQQRGWQVRALARRPEAVAPSLPGVTVFHCELPHALDAAAFEGVNVVVHCAWLMKKSAASEARAVNEDGTSRVLAAARAAGARRFVFLSSAAAHSEAESDYGRSKLRVEGALDPARDLLLRPGLVLERDEGLFSRLSKLIRKAPIVPLFDADKVALQTVHLDDLVEGLRRALELDLTGPLCVAEPEPISLRTFVTAIAARLHRHPLLLPLPTCLALAVFRGAEALRLPLPFSSENLLGLRAMRVMPTLPDLRRLGLDVRTAFESIDALFSREDLRVDTR